MGLRNKYINLIKNIGVFAISNFAVKIVTFLVLPLYTYYLTTSEYAVIDLVNTTAQLVMPFLSLCIVDAVLRFGITNEHKLDTIFTNAFFSILVGCCTLPIFLILFKKLIDFEGLEKYFIIIYLLQVFNSLFSTFYKAINKVKEMAVISMINSISIVGLNVLFVAVLKWGIEGYFISVIIGNFIAFLLYVIIGKLYCYLKPKAWDSSLLKEMLIYSIPLIPNALFWWINSSLDKYALTAMTTLSIVGLYSVANKIPTIITTVTSIFSQAWNLSAFQAYNDVEKEEFYNSTYLIFRNLMMICTAGVILLSKIFAMLLFSKDFYEGWIFVPILTLGVFYSSINSFIGSLFTASKKTKYIFYTTGAGSIVNIIFNFVLIKMVGAQGAAIATLISYLVVWVVRSKKIQEIVALKINFKMEIIILIALLLESALIICNTWLSQTAAVVIVIIICVLGGKELYLHVKHKREM